MRTVLSRLRPVFNADGGGGGGGGGDNTGGGSTWSAPQGFPQEFVGANAEESYGKLLAGYSDLSTRFGGMREKLSKMPAALEKPELYAFAPDDKLKPFFGDLDNNPAFASARNAAHKHGLSQDQFAGFIADVYSPLVDQGVLASPFNPENELKSYQAAFSFDGKGLQESLAANETFAKGLTGQLQGIPADMKPDIDAMLLGLTDTAAGNALLKAISGRLADSGIRISGQGGGQGALTAEDLKKLDGDPRIDPRNRDHQDPAQRFDESLRKQYDEAYTRLYPSR